MHCGHHSRHAHSTPPLPHSRTLTLTSQYFLPQSHVPALRSQVQAVLVEHHVGGLRRQGAVAVDRARAVRATLCCSPPSPAPLHPSPHHRCPAPLTPPLPHPPHQFPRECGCVDVGEERLGRAGHATRVHGPQQRGVGVRGGEEAWRRELRVGWEARVTRHTGKPDTHCVMHCLMHAWQVQSHSKCKAPPHRCLACVLTSV